MHVMKRDNGMMVVGLNCQQIISVPMRYYCSHGMLAARVSADMMQWGCEKEGCVAGDRGGGGGGGHIGRIKETYS